MPSYVLSVTPQSSAKLNVLWIYRLVVSFISVAFVVVKFMNFQINSWHVASMKWPLLGGFWSLSPTNMTRVCWNFNQRYVFHKRKTFSEQSFKIKCLSGNRTYPKLMVLVHYYVQFTRRKPKILPKTKFFPEFSSLWLSNNTSSRSQINYRIFIKLIKKTFFVPKMDTLM